ncbi:Signal transduction histidine kinase [Polynucleobacter meluiroseus]|uniref:histidine kinase n=1 Tax=Polynucleobacter meluiroseus TaxID=1938814 RepID=A0A240E1Q7_9BURK|nr:HAMP domain-containing sensor histidine kinase [Polynucleobacter meluiroseus]SNX29203.1 Signal transduction histidine kinase [Polynucleobacter meluiroseus]
MQQFTIQTLFILYSAISLSAGVLIAALFWKKNDASAKLWIYGCAATAIATLVTVFRGEIPVFFSYSMMVSLETLSILLLAESLKRLSTQKFYYRLSWFTPILPALLFAIVEFERNANDGQIAPLMTATSTIFFGIANLICFYQANLTSREFENKVFFKFLMGVFILVSGLYFMRSVNVFSGYSGFAFDLKTYNLIIWCCIILLGSIRNLTYIILRLHLGFTEHSRINNMNLKLGHALEGRNEMILSLQKLNRSASINALASTISHEINQPLGATKLNAQFLEMKLESDPTNVALLKELNKSMLGDINRAAEIVKNLSRMTKNENDAVTVVNVSESIAEVMEISKSKLQTKRITFEFNCNPDHQININLAEWQQVLINLFNNAIEAFDELEQDHKKIIFSSIATSDLITISIQDNGHGIKAGQEAKIFELMVTNKATGTGIGLWLSKNIINRHGGEISARNNQDSGACFMIELPRA